MSDVKVDGFKCESCGHKWAPREKATGVEHPTVCPKCKSPYWDRGHDLKDDGHRTAASRVAEKFVASIVDGASVDKKVE